MSPKKRRPDRPTTNAASSPATDAATPTDEGQSTGRSRRLFFIAFIVLATWLITLGLLVVFTANPVTLNREQILHATHIVTGRVDDIAAGQVTVEKVWLGRELSGDVTIEALAQTGVKAGRSYVFPLGPDEGDGRYRIVLTPPADHRPLVYPAGEEAAAQLETILAEASESESRDSAGEK